MGPNRDQVKGRIKTRDQDDPELNEALQSARELRNQEFLNKRNKLERNDKLDLHLHRLQIVAIYIGGISIGGLFLVLVWHHGVASTYRFLSSDQLENLQQFLFSGTIGTILGVLGKRLFK